MSLLLKDFCIKDRFLCGFLMCFTSKKTFLTIKKMLVKKYNLSGTLGAKQLVVDMTHKIFSEPISAIC